DCHEDRHQGQLVQDCGSCHAEQAWTPVPFDHDSARFRLDGAHVGVPCERCHLQEQTAAGARFRRYRPLAVDCGSCHGPEGGPP
ncbi:MAG: hypothetical protein WDA75_14655, partial [Candidatus Latescibacterota bacterium]